MDLAPKSDGPIHDFRPLLSGSNSESPLNALLTRPQTWLEKNNIGIGSLWATAIACALVVSGRGEKTRKRQSNMPQEGNDGCLTNRGG